MQFLMRNGPILAQRARGMRCWRGADIMLVQRQIEVLIRLEVLSPPLLRLMVGGGCLALGPRRAAFISARV